MKPMLAANAKIEDIQFPTYASAKLDGIRALVMEGTVFARSLKELPNVHVQHLFGDKILEDLDGELIYGDPRAGDVYRQTVSIVNSDKKEAAGVKLYIFDFIDPVETFEARHKVVKIRVAQALRRGIPVVALNQMKIDNEKELREYEDYMLEEGYEGLILRSPVGLYKFGRSTIKQQGMLKLKRFVDSEAIINDIEEEMHNTNEAKTNALGRTERSSAQDGLVGKGRAGTLCVTDVSTGVSFRIGTGLDDADRDYYWTHRKDVIGRTIKYKSFPVGVKDKPRHPVYLGPREDWDL